MVQSEVRHQWLLYPAILPLLACPPPIDAICNIKRIQKTTLKARSIQIYCRISHIMIPTYTTRLLIRTVSLAWPYCTIKEPQDI